MLLQPRSASDAGITAPWTEDRSENMVAMVHSRAQVQYCELGCKADGTFIGLRVRLVGDEHPVVSDL